MGKSSQNDEISHMWGAKFNSNSHQAYTLLEIDPNAPTYTEPPDILDKEITFNPETGAAIIQVNEGDLCYPIAAPPASLNLS